MAKTKERLKIILLRVRASKKIKNFAVGYRGGKGRRNPAKGIVGE